MAEHKEIPGAGKKKLYRGGCLWVTVSCSYNIQAVPGKWTPVIGTAKSNAVIGSVEGDLAASGAAVRVSLRRCR